jgi:hypothetical protein
MTSCSDDDQVGSDLTTHLGKPVPDASGHHRDHLDRSVYAPVAKAFGLLFEADDDLVLVRTQVAAALAYGLFVDMGDHQLGALVAGQLLRNSQGMFSSL